MLLTYRAVDAKDISTICAFPQNEEELFFMFPKAEYPLTPVRIGAAIDERSDSTVVLADGQVAGFANFYRWETGGRCSIGNVVIDPTLRGKGVGRYLVECMIGLAVSRHRAHEITISCFNRNTFGLLLYSKLGFTPHGIEERMDYAGNRVALIHMARAVRSSFIEE